MEGTSGLRPGALRVAVERVSESRWVVTLAGELDRFTVPRLTEALDLAAGGDDGAVVLDMSACSFVDSSGLSALVAADGALRSSGRRLEVVASPFLLRILRATGLDTLLAVRPRPGEDVARASEQPAGM